MLGIWALVVIIFCVRRLPKVPGYIVALFVGTALVWVLKLPVETIGTRFGGIPSGLPTLNIPAFHFSHLRPLIGPAITVAMLGAIESLMSAVVSDRMSGDKHNPNVELVAQGIANIVSPLFGGLPATGAIAQDGDEYSFWGAHSGGWHGACADACWRFCYSRRRWRSSFR